MARFDSFNLEVPTNLGGFLSPSVMPPLGPKPGVISMCGVEIECFKLLRCSIVGTEGEPRGDPSVSIERGCLFAAPVFRLSRLGFRRAFNGGGLINEGDEGSEG